MYPLLSSPDRDESSRIKKKEMKKTMDIPISKTIVVLSIFLFGVVGSANANYQISSLNNRKITNKNIVRPIGLASKKPYRMSWKALQFLHAHNKVRLIHREPPLQWSQPLARYARQYAKKRAADCKMVHSNGKYGENIMWGQIYDNYTPAKIVGFWASEKQYYDAAHNTCAPNQMCGHYTQIVWLDTTKVGCAMVKCHNGGVFAVCNYDPPGNYEGESPFDRHV